ncbi:MAG: NAD(P)-binding protein [Rhodospirillales bacterium]|nr:NAD(P)-binding protein [Rhodospirillales bacterium]
MFDALIVGAGFAGSVLAERLANEGDNRILLIDRRPHIGGNAYDRFDKAGNVIAPYGRHVLQTGDRRVINYLSRFAEWERYCSDGPDGGEAAEGAGEGGSMLVPSEGYTRMFETMLASPNVKIMLKVDYKEVRDLVPFRRLIYTGSLDDYFDYCYGRLPYWPAEKNGTAPHRAPARQFDAAEVVPERPEDKAGYPVAGDDSRALFQRYRDLAETAVDVYFTGRLPSYRYCTIDEVVVQSLALFHQLKSEYPADVAPRGNAGARGPVRAVQAANA